MARIGVSEFTFGFAYMNEQVLRSKPDLIAAPIFPSLSDEQMMESESEWRPRVARGPRTADRRASPSQHGDRAHHGCCRGRE